MLPDPSEEIENARALARDAALYGTNVTDVTGRRVDPATILPSAAGGSDRSAEMRDPRGLTLPWPDGPDTADPIGVARRKLTEDLEAIAAWCRIEGQRCAGYDHCLFSGAERIEALAAGIAPRPWQDRGAA